MDSHPQATNAPPPRMSVTRGRPRQVDTTGHFCPHTTCSYHGWVDWGNIRANGHPSGRCWRQLVCLSCRGYFLETHDTIFHGKQVDPDKLVWAITALTEGLGIRAVARVFETDPNTVLRWLVEAAEHLEGAPLFLTDEFREYLTALVTHYGEWIQPERRQAKGPLPKPRWMPLPQLLYAQVVKSYRRRRLTAVTHRVVFGARETIESILAKRGWTINTSLIERLNLEFRQHVAAIGRRVNTLCKHEAGMQQQLAIFQTYHNFVIDKES